MIQKVKVHEVRGTGVQSNARRAVEWEEFVNVLIAVREIYSESSKAHSMLMALSVLTLQWQLIGRIDDISWDGLDLIDQIAAIYSNYDFGTEILAASKEEGAAVKKRVDTHKMAEANKAFSHFRF